MADRNVDVAFLNKPGYAITSTSTQSSPSPSTRTSSSATSKSSSTNSSSSIRSLYSYKPSIPIAGVIAGLYFLLVPYYFYLSIWKPLIAKSVAQKHTYTIPLFVASVLSTIGFASRIPSAATAKSQQDFGLYGISQVCIIISPIFICATLYLMIAHLMRICLPPGPEQDFLRISPKAIGILFLVSDVLCFLFQASGSAIAASGGWRGDKAIFGKNLLLVGLVAQLVTFTIFLIVLAMFCLRVKGGHKEEHEMSRQNSDVAGRDFGFNPLAKEVVKGMWVAGVLLEIRSVYRVAQFGAGPEGYLFQHEWTLWVFEAVPVWFALLLLGIFHPIKWLQSKRPSQFIQKKQSHRL